MIVYASPRTQGIDSEGNTQPVGVVGADQDELKIADLEARDWLQDIIKELRIMNVQISAMTDIEIDKKDIVGD